MDMLLRKSTHLLTKSALYSLDGAFACAKYSRLLDNILAKSHFTIAGLNYSLSDSKAELILILIMLLSWVCFSVSTLSSSSL